MHTKNTGIDGAHRSAFVVGHAHITNGNRWAVILQERLNFLQAHGLFGGRRRDLSAFTAHLDVHPHAGLEAQSLAYGDRNHNLAFGGDQYSGHDELSKFYQVGDGGVMSDYKVFHAPNALIAE